MTTYRNFVTGQNLSNSTAALFREWGKWISDALTAGGQAKTADTGQIDWSTVNAPANSAYAGYEIRKFTDALSATYPIYYKLEFGATSLGNPVLKVTIGTGSNGSGTLTGITFQCQTSPDQRISSTTNQTARYISVDPNRVSLDMNVFGFSSLFGPNIIIERTKDSNYGDTSQGIIARQGDSSGGGYSTRTCVRNFDNNNAPDETQGTGMIPISGSTVDGANVAVFPIPIFNIGKLMKHAIFFGYRNTDIATGTVFTLNINGTPVDFLATGAQGSPTFAINRNGNSIALRY